MKNIMSYLTLLLLFVGTALSGQGVLNIMDDTYLDIIFHDDYRTEIVGRGNGPCDESHAITYQNSTKVNPLYLGRADRTYYEKRNGKIYILAENVVDDTYTTEMTTLYIIENDESIYIQPKVDSTLITSIIDFTVDENEVIYFMDAKRQRITSMTTESTPIQHYTLPVNAKKIIYFNNNFFISTTEEVLIYDVSFELLERYPFTTVLHDFDIDGGKLFLTAEDHLFMWDEENFTFDDLIILDGYTDFSYDNDTLEIILPKLGESLIYTYSIAELENPVTIDTLLSNSLYIESFAGGDKNDILFGNQHKISGNKSGIKVNKQMDQMPQWDIAVNLIEVWEEKFPMEHTKTHIRFSIENRSDQIIDEFRIQSDVYGRFGCGDIFISGNYTTSLQPMEIDTFEASQIIFNTLEEYCINVISANGIYDDIQDNNRSCNFLSSSKDINNTNQNNFYPNPVLDIINIKEDVRPSKVEIYSITGRKLQTSTLSSIIVSDLEAGIYLIRIYKEDNSVITEKFVKN